jgi:hypothetical protein
METYDEALKRHQPELDRIANDEGIELTMRHADTVMRINKLTECKTYYFNIKFVDYDNRTI